MPVKKSAGAISKTDSERSLMTALCTTAPAQQELDT
jgi:hypothetical protein